jgi:hypothetical protein
MCGAHLDSRFRGNDGTEFKVSENLDSFPVSLSGLSAGAYRRKFSIPYVV